MKRLIVHFFLKIKGRLFKGKKPYFFAAGILTAVLMIAVLYDLDFGENRVLQAQEELRYRIGELVRTHRPLLKINFSTIFGNQIHYQVLHPMLNVENFLNKLQDPGPSGAGGYGGIGGFAAPLKDENQSYWEEMDPALRWASKNKVVEQIEQMEIAEIKTRAPLIRTRDFLLVRDQSQFGLSSLGYLVFEADELNQVLQNSKYELVRASVDSFCLVRVGNTCWTYNSKHFVSYLQRYSLYVKWLVIVLVLLLVGFLGRYFYFKSKEHQKHRLALQVLSHEFRTPVTSLVLLIEDLSKDLSRFSTREQDLFTRISGEVFQLQRIVEMSRNYLQSASHKIEMRQVEIPSVNAWMHDFLADFEGLIRCDFLEKDRSIKADPFFLKLVLTNLIQNALHHGKPPVAIRLNDLGNRVEVNVQDQGSCEFESLEEMTEAFKKSNQSTGMGLGLNIAASIVQAWGGEIRFRKNPTTFSLSLQSEGVV